MPSLSCIAFRREYHVTDSSLRSCAMVMVMVGNVTPLHGRIPPETTRKHGRLVYRMLVGGIRRILAFVLGERN